MKLNKSFTLESSSERNMLVLLKLVVDKNQADIFLMKYFC